MKNVMDDEIPQIEIRPKFNFIYELGMPTGRKIRSSIILFIIFFVVFLLLGKNSSIDLSEISATIHFDLQNAIHILSMVAMGIAVIQLIVHLIFRILQYKHISYRFYEDHMIYEDDFLNQHRKTIQYTNIKEIEIRRTIWDRILNYGIIIIHTNAENRNNGIIIYSIKNPRKYYILMDGLIHSKQELMQENKIEESENEEVNSQSIEISNENDFSDKQE